MIAENTFAAIKGRAQLEIQWDDGPNASYDSVQYRKTLEAAAAKPGQVVRNNGDVDAALAGAAKRVSAEYYLPHLAQAPMEPPSATARVTAGACEVWCSTQNAEAIRTDLSKRFNVPIDKVTVNNLLLGGGFGRKSKPDFASEAAICSHAMGGRPVKLTFTREDDLQHSFFHTVSVERLEAGLDANGKAVAWLHRTVAPTIAAIFAPGANHEMPLELAMGAVDNPFAIPNFRVENPEAAAHTRVGWFRSVSNIPHAFAIQSFVAELAASLGRDPKDYLLELIGPARLIDASAMSDAWLYGEDPKRYPFDTGRLRAVIEKAASEAGWGRKLPQGRGLGIAAHRSFVSYTAVVTEVAVGPKGELTIPRVDIAFDCGAVVNPDRVRSQLEGAVVQGVSLATLGEISFKNGRVEQTNFDGYELTRIDGSPTEIRTHLREHDGVRQAAGRRRRARRAAGGTSARQRDLRRQRQAHPQPADPRPARGEGVAGPSYAAHVPLPPLGGEEHELLAVSSRCLLKGDRHLVGVPSNIFSAEGCRSPWSIDRCLPRPSQSSATTLEPRHGWCSSRYPAFLQT